ncbi:hypothetical protein RhiirA5_383403 [Rhizophagus irregularis]|uniref:DDE-1 domain-containing protein n=1 Tax=Rhizophagus irregularis TaxID=588596 RepID=A0A2N0NX64_9GLOM|nr:hypothetical protein RhiirA5_383403 [Rhizophagus irregularis]
MDETPIWFDMAGNFTINSTGEKTIQICRTGNKKNCFTVVLIVVADGTKFPSICIFKEKRLPHNEQIPSGDSAEVIALGNPRYVRLFNICGWVKCSWEKISDEMVIEPFKTCRISTSLDGLDDEITDKDSDVGNDNVDGDNYKLITNSNK